VDHAAVLRLVVGLGNPGRQYADTRHNVGFLVLDELARRAAVTFHFDSKWDADVAPCGGRLLMKPQTFMNLSGEPAGNYVRYHRLDPSEVLVVLDDAALPFGDLRLRKTGGPGGHNGLESVLMHMGTETVPRLRFGIGAATESLHDHVLGKFLPEEQAGLKTTIGRAADAVEYASAHGFEPAMNIYNQKPTP
jgi:PTH1 family peptidyl-tRNA hydrolase